MEKNQPQAQIVEKAQLKTRLQIKHNIKEKSQIMSVRFAQDDSMMAYGTGDGHLKIYNLLKNNKIHSIPLSKNKENSENAPVTAIKWRPSSEKFESIGAILTAVTGGGKIYQFMAKNGKLLFEGTEQDNQIFALDYSADATMFSTAGKDCAVRVYDEQTKKIKITFQNEKGFRQGHANRIFGLKFKPNNLNLIASGGWDQNINVWDLRVGKVTQTLCGPRITGDTIDFREDLVLTGSNRLTQALQLWDYRTQKVIHSYVWEEGKKQGGFINSCQFCPNSTNTILASGKNTMKMFTLDDKTELFELKLREEESIFSCDTSQENNKYIAAGKDGILYYLLPTKSE